MKSTFFALALFVAANSFAGDNSYISDSKFVPDRDLFNANEVSLDIFGSYVEVDSILMDDDWGAGAGVNYFFSKYVGVGTDILFFNGDGNVTNLSGNIILRAPIENGSWGLAPYLIGGVGGTFDAPVDEVYGHIGAGLEVRVTPTIGVFGDARYAFEYDTDDLVVFRTGVRFVF